MTDAEQMQVLELCSMATVVAHNEDVTPSEMRELAKLANEVRAAMIREINALLRDDDAISDNHG